MNRTGEQARAFLAAAKDDRLFALYVLALDTGARQGELFGLRWPDVTFQTGVIKIQRTLSELHGHFAEKEPKTKAGRRMVQLSAFGLTELNQHRQRMLAEGQDVKEGLVFCDQRGGYLRKSNITRRSFRSIMKKAGVPCIRFHDMRHSAASLAIASGVNALVIQHRLGHSRIEVTLGTYGHLFENAQQAAADAMNAVLVPRAATKFG